MTGELWRLTAVEAANAVRSRKVTSLELVTAGLCRIAAINASVNAVVLALREEAMNEATRADHELARGNIHGPLHGVPITTKINVDQSGLPTDNGVTAYRDNVAHADNPVVAKLRTSGAICIGRTNSPAFALRWTTENALHGRTLTLGRRCTFPAVRAEARRPLLPRGMGALALGNDIAGSIRYPAFCCGVLGLRPTLGRIAAFNATSSSVSISAQLMGVQGPLARTVADLSLAFDAMRGASPVDPRSIDASDAPLPGLPIRIAICPGLGNSAVHPAIKRAVVQVGTRLSSLGYLVDEVDPPHFRETADLWPEIAMPDYVKQLGAVDRSDGR